MIGDEEWANRLINVLVGLITFSIAMGCSLLIFYQVFSIMGLI